MRPFAGMVVNCGDDVVVWDVPASAWSPQDVWFFFVPA
jgi:hypothetical protein